MITKFSSWKPEGLEKPEAILVLTPPSQSDGRYETRDRKWQEFAVKHNLALVGCYFQDNLPSGVEDYCNARESGNALATYLHHNGWVYESLQGGIPILMWGFSAGGQFNYEFSCRFPQLVKGFVVNKGGIYYTHVCSQQTRDIPALWITGFHDSQWRKDSVYGIFAVNKVIGAPKWKHIEEQNFSHETGESEQLGMEFFESILKK